MLKLFFQVVITYQREAVWLSPGGRYQTALRWGGNTKNGTN